jgi:hypothetical protein
MSAGAETRDGRRNGVVTVDPLNGVWLDRWFEAARSILELLYVRETRR